MIGDLPTLGRITVPAVIPHEITDREVNLLAKPNLCAVDSDKIVPLARPLESRWIANLRLTSASGMTYDELDMRSNT